MSVKIRVDNLVRFYVNLARALGEKGISGSQLNTIFSTCLQAECTRCGIKITGDEIGQIAVTEPKKQLPHPKLERLRLGSCASQNCESYLYWIHLAGYPGVEWEVLAEKAGNLKAAVKAAAQAEEKRQRRLKRNRLMKRIGMGLIIVALFLLLRFLIQNHRLPFMHKSHKYEIDPASVSRESLR